MMQKNRQLFGTLCALSALALLSFTGCGGGDLECGEGTFERDGECVFEGGDNQNDCPAGEVRWDGECVDAGSLCSEGTEFDEDAQGCVAVGGGELDCGAGTVENDGICVPSADACGANTTLDAQNRCIADDPVECSSPNTELDPNANECIVTSEVCAGTTAYDVESETCVSTSDVCDEGTTYNEDTGLCMTAINCRAGDVVLDGTCVPPAEALWEDVETFGIGPAAFADLEVKDIGEQTIFGGTVSPPTIGPEGELQQDLDLFSFTAEEGDWFELTIQSVDGKFATGFYVTDGGDYFRLSPMISTANKTRQITIPETGEYIVVVAPESALLQPDYVVGADDWDYVGTLEKLETPSGEQYDYEQENLEGVFGSLTDKFYHFDAVEAGDIVEFTWDHLGWDAYPAVTIWAAPGEYVMTDTGFFSFLVEVPDSGEFYMNLDWELIFGQHEIDYELSAVLLDRFPDGDTIEEAITAQSFQILEVTQSNRFSSDVTVRVEDDAGEPVAEEEVASGTTFRYVWLDAGDYTVIIENNTGSGVFELDYDVRLDDPTLFPGIGEELLGTSNQLHSSDQDYFVITGDNQLAEDTDVKFTLGVTEGPGQGQVYVYGENNELLRQLDSSVSNGEAGSLWVTLEADTDYIIRVGNDLTTDSSFEYDLSSGEITVNYISIEGNAFDPDELTIDVGEVVVWTNNEDVTHTVTADEGAFDSGDLGEGDVFELFFEEAGSFDYNCDYHDMPARITVVEPQ